MARKRLDQPSHLDLYELGDFTPQEETMTSSVTIDESVVNQAITPLRLIFWGGLLCIFDFHLTQTTNGHGFKFDVLSDALGSILIAVGVFRLGAIPIHDRL